MRMTDERKQTFWVEPLAGLGNRMQVLASAYFLAEKYHKRLCILWNHNSDLAAEFGDIFEPVPGAEVIPVTTDGYHEKPFLRMKSERLRRKLSSECGFVTEVDAWDGMDAGEIAAMVEKGVRDAAGCYVKSWKPFMPVYEHTGITLDFLRPSEKVRQRGKELFDRISPDTVGVHIRRTDHTEAIAESPIAAFVERMREEQNRNPECCFFVATDDKEVEQEMVSRFGSCVFFKENKSWGRQQTDGILDACVDLWALSKCRKILGSKGSTFGMIAAKLGFGEIEIVTK